MSVGLLGLPPDQIGILQTCGMFRLIPPRRSKAITGTAGLLPTGTDARAKEPKKQGLPRLQLRLLLLLLLLLLLPPLPLEVYSRCILELYVPNTPKPCSKHALIKAPLSVGISRIRAASREKTTAYNAGSQLQSCPGLGV